MKINKFYKRIEDMNLALKNKVALVALVLLSNIGVGLILSESLMVPQLAGVVGGYQCLDASTGETSIDGLKKQLVTARAAVTKASSLVVANAEYKRKTSLTKVENYLAKTYEPQASRAADAQNALNDYYDTQLEKISKTASTTKEEKAEQAKQIEEIKRVIVADYKKPTNNGSKLTPEQRQAEIDKRLREAEYKILYGEKYTTYLKTIDTYAATKKLKAAAVQAEKLRVQYKATYDRMLALHEKTFPTINQAAADALPRLEADLTLKKALASDLAYKISYFRILKVCDTREVMCGDGIDSDDDGLTDCADPDCAGDSRCIPEGRNSSYECSNKRDDDSDGLIDCQDPDCANETACRTTSGGGGNSGGGNGGGGSGDGNNKPLVSCCVGFYEEADKNLTEASKTQCRGYIEKCTYGTLLPDVGGGVGISQAAMEYCDGTAVSRLFGGGKYDVLSVFTCGHSGPLSEDGIGDKCDPEDVVTDVLLTLSAQGKAIPAGVFVENLGCSTFNSLGDARARAESIHADLESRGYAGLVTISGYQNLSCTDKDSIGGYVKYSICAEGVTEEFAWCPPHNSDCYYDDPSGKDTNHVFKCKLDNGDVVSRRCSQKEVCITNPGDPECNPYDGFVE